MSGGLWRGEGSEGGDKARAGWLAKRRSEVSNEGLGRILNEWGQWANRWQIDGGIY